MIGGYGITGPGDHEIRQERRCECGALLDHEGRCAECAEREERGRRRLDYMDRVRNRLAGVEWCP